MMVKKASAVDYQSSVREVNAETPARFNADPNRLYKSSGCAGKLAVFAVRLDTFEKPHADKVFYIGTKNPYELNTIRQSVLQEFNSLPELGEYMHQSYFDAADVYCKDTFLIIRRLGTRYLSRLWVINAAVETFFSRLKWMPSRFADRVTLFIARLFPDHLPARIREFRVRYEHHLIVKATDENIDEMRALMSRLAKSQSFSGDYFECDDLEAEAALQHRFVAGGALNRLVAFDKAYSAIMPLDISLRRNDESWPELLDMVDSELVRPLVLSHFFCNVFHLDFVVKQGVDPDALKRDVLKKLDERGARYPAEHNVGHYYDAEDHHKGFYQALDPTNTFNAGVGRMSKKKHYR